MIATGYTYFSQTMNRALFLHGYGEEELIFPFFIFV